MKIKVIKLGTIRGGKVTVAGTLTVHQFRRAMKILREPEPEQ